MAERMGNSKGRTAAASLLLCLVAGSALASPYLDMIPDFWRGVYPDGGQSLYCGDAFARWDRRYNIEHVFPMAWVGRALDCGNRRQCRERSALFNRIETDMHNLFAVRKTINRARGSMAFGEISGEAWLQEDCDFELDRGARRVEPRPAARGDIARAMLYMADRYPLTLFRRQRELLLRWHAQDPVDDAERQRHARIRTLQGWANPWIERSAD